MGLWKLCKGMIKIKQRLMDKYLKIRKRYVLILLFLTLVILFPQQKEDLR